MMPPGWSHSEGFRPYTVTAYEDQRRGRAIYLRWRVRRGTRTNWKVEKTTIATVRSADGKIIKARAQEAIALARAKHLELVKGHEASPAVARVVTIAEGMQMAFDPSTGKYPVPSAHRKEVEQSISFALHTWGQERTWESVKRPDLIQLWRARMAQLRAKGASGHRGAEITIARVLAVAQWLKDSEHIPVTACVAPRTWHQDLKADWVTLYGEKREPEPARPRHTLDEMRRILFAARDLDPRFFLLLTLGAELRLGQVRRCRRSDLNLEAGTLSVPSHGRKRGPVSHLTAGQLAITAAVLSGFYQELETSGQDYPLFPGGRLARGMVRRSDVPLDRTAPRKWFRQAEKLAGVPHLKGRGPYGLRRAAVDAAKDLGISRGALKEHGGWKDLQMPDQVYADQEREQDREEAKAIRAKIRGEEP